MIEKSAVVESKMRASLISNSGDLYGLRDEWNALAACQERDGFFRSFDWYNTWLRRVADNVEPFVIVVRDESSRVLGIAPMYRETIRGLPSIGLGGSRMVAGDFLGFLYDQQSPDVCEAILDELYSLRAQWVIARFGEVVAGSPLEQQLNSWARRHSFQASRSLRRVCPYMELPSKVENLLATLSPNMRSNLRRHARELSRRGAEFATFAGCDVRAHLDSLVSLHQQRWTAVGKPGRIGNPMFRGFLEELLSNLSCRFSARLHFLMYQGQAVASVLMFYCGDKAYYFQAGWDVNSPIAPLSPGTVLMVHSMEEAIRNGLRYYDFLRGDEEYKQRWTKTFRVTSTLQYGRTVVGQAYILASMAKESTKNVIRQMLPSPKLELTQR